MNKHLFRLAAAGAACLIAGTAALAQPMPPDGPDRHGLAGHPRLAGLELSEAQQDRVFAILHEGAPRRREIDKAERKARAPEFDQGKAAQHAQALGQAIADEAMLRLRQDTRIMAVLTPEQRARLERRQDRQASDAR